jgi:single-strand DNA-binding protein
MSINRFIVMGHLGDNPEMRYTAEGEAVALVRVATNSRYKDKKNGEMKDATEWHRLTAFGKRAQVIEKFCAKGDKVYFESYHRTRKFTDQATNQDRYTDEFIVTFIELTTKKGEVKDPGDDGDGPGAGEAFQAI